MNKRSDPTQEVSEQFAASGTHRGNGHAKPEEQALMARVFAGMRDHGTGEKGPFKFDVPKFRVDPAPDGGKFVTFTLHVPKGYHPLGPELDRNDR